MIDGSIFLGRNPSTGVTLDSAAALGWMDDSGIQCAIALSYKSVFFDFRIGNQDILNLAQKHPGRFIPSVFVHPSGFDTFKDKDYFSGVQKQGARVLNLFSSPKYYEMPWQSPLVKAILKSAVEAGLTIQLGISSLAEMHLLPSLLSEIQTPVLLRWTGGRAYNAVAEFLNFGKILPNALFDVSSLTPSGAIKHLVQSLGAERFYLASGAPETIPFCGSFLLEMSDLNKDDLEKIKNGNLSRIFQWETLPVNNAPDKPRALLNHLTEIPKIDTHWHTGGWNILEPQKNTDFFPVQMQKFNIKKIILSSIHALNYDIQEGNSELFSWVSSQKDAFALIVLDPLQPVKSLEEIQRYAQHPKCAGLKTIQDLYGLRLDDKAYLPLLEAGLKAGLPVMAHIPGMKEVARLFQGMSFICAHATYGRVSKMLGEPNIFFDIATSHSDAAETQMARLIREAGEDRIIFSSDAPLMDPSWTLAKVADAQLTQSQLDKLFRKNALKAFPRLNAAVTD